MGVYINHTQHIQWMCLYWASEPLTNAGVRTVHFAAGIGLVAWGTTITLGPCCMVHATLTHSSAPPPTGFVHSWIKTASPGVAVALTTWGTKHCELFQITFNRFSEHLASGIVTTICTNFMYVVVRPYAGKSGFCPPLQASRAGHWRDHRSVRSSCLRCCVDSHTEGSPVYQHTKQKH